LGGTLRRGGHESEEGPGREWLPAGRVTCGSSPTSSAPPRARARQSQRLAATSGTPQGDWWTSSRPRTPSLGYAAPVRIAQLPACFSRPLSLAQSFPPHLPATLSFSLSTPSTPRWPCSRIAPPIRASSRVGAIGDWRDQRTTRCEKASAHRPLPEMVDLHGRAVLHRAGHSEPTSPALTNTHHHRRTRSMTRGAFRQASKSSSSAPAVGGWGSLSQETFPLRGYA